MIRKLDWSSGKVFAYEASGKLTKEEHIAIYEELRHAIKKYGKIRIFVRLPKFAWPEISAIKERFEFAKEHFFDIERYAVVSDISFVNWVSFFLAMIPGFKYRFYNTADELLAKTWIEAKHT